MTPELRELLHASIEFRHAKALAAMWRDSASSDDAMPRDVAEAVRSASERLITASWNAEQADGPLAALGGGGNG